MGILLEARRKAARGARRLDEIEPEWFRRVDVTSLDMRDGRHSVLGQGGLTIDAEVAVRWAALHYAWLREVCKRLQHPAKRSAAVSFDLTGILDL
jgi:hypothetical protein